MKTTRADGTPISMAASHELVEMLVDPSMNLEVMKPDGKLVHRYEAADPVQELHFLVNGMRMSDFVYPAYFESFHKPGSVKFDHNNVLKKPFQIHLRGYQSVYVNGKWTLRFGSRAKQKKYEKEDRRGHRLHRRAVKKRRRSAKTHVRRSNKRHSCTAPWCRASGSQSFAICQAKAAEQSWRSSWRIAAGLASNTCNSTASGVESRFGDAVPTEVHAASMVECR